MNFIKTFLASLLAVVVGGIIICMVAVLMFVGFMIAVGNSALGLDVYDNVVLSNNTVLKIDLTEGVTEEPSKYFAYNTLGGLVFDRSNDILQVINAIEHATYDDQIKGIYINARYGSISASNLEELRSAIQRFKDASGKFVVAYSDSYSQLEYYLATVADRVYLNPEGSLAWKGMASNVLFYKGMLDKLGIKPEIVRHGRFKSAVEPFVLDKMSPESRMQLETVLASLWNAIVLDVAGARGIDHQVLNNYASDLTIESADYALQLDMVDGLRHEDEVLSLLKKLAMGEVSVNDLEDTKNRTGLFDGIDEVPRGFAMQIDDDELLMYGEETDLEYEPDTEEMLVENVTADTLLAGDKEDIFSSLWKQTNPSSTKHKSKKKDPVLVSLNGYINHLGMNTGFSFQSSSNNNIAVVYANGDIIDGRGEDGYVGGQTLAEKLASVREDETVKAVVLRVNSPGGSALASEVIWREVELLKKDKPVIVSMGSMAASGGYYISCPADAILTNKLTLTGSIGVFGVLVDASGAMEDKLGITIDVAKTNDFADFGSIFRGVAPREREVLKRNIEQCYVTFINHVADGRNLTLTQVDEMGEGRVWSGVNAVNNGLADGYGGIYDAIELAASRAGISDDYEILHVDETLSGLSGMMRSLSNSHSRALQDELGEAFKYYRSVKSIVSETGVQARMPYIIELID